LTNGFSSEERARCGFLSWGHQKGHTVQTVWRERMKSSGETYLWLRNHTGMVVAEQMRLESVILFSQHHWKEFNDE